MRRDRIVGIVCIAVSVFFGYHSLNIKASLNPGDPGAKLFPLIGCAILLLCGAVMLLKRGGGHGQFMTREQWLRALALFAVYILTFVMMWLLGFVISNTLMLFVLCLMFTGGDGGGKVKTAAKAAVYAAVLSAALYLIYKVGLNVQIPRGLLWELLG